MRTDQRAGVASRVPEATAGGQAFDWLSAVRGLRASADARWLTAILIVALIVRVAWVSSIQPDPRDGRFDDTVWYYGTAQHLLDGDGYVFPGDSFCQFGDDIGCDEHPATALWAPGYSVILAGVFALPGDDVAAARALNVAAGLGLVLGVYYLGRRLFDARAGLIAAGIVALFPSLVFFSSLMLTETIFGALAVGLLCLAAAWTLDHNGTFWRAFGIGLAAGAVAMVRPEGIVFAGIIVVTWIVVYRSWRTEWPYAAALAAGILVFVIPWTVRNAVQLDAPVLGTTGLGVVLIQGHHPAADAYPEYFIAQELTDRFEDVPRPEKEVRINNTGVRESIEYAVKHPGREVELVPQRFAAFYRGDRGAIVWNQSEDGSDRRQLSGSWAERWGVVSDAYYYIVLAIAVLALPLWALRSGAKHLLLWGPLAAYSAMWAFLFVGEPRYHLPVLPFFAIMAAAGLAALWQRGARVKDHDDPSLKAGA
jgi:4-amino-4-deoxy-L-arabinose transferase-like glycosyltransferase